MNIEYKRDLQKEIDAAWEQYHKQKANEAANLYFVSIRERLAEAQNWRCCYCGVRMYRYGDADNSATLEHIQPKSLGGTNHEDNLVVACNKDNKLRGNTTWDVHREVMEILGIYW